MVEARKPDEAVVLIVAQFCLKGRRQDRLMCTGRADFRHLITPALICLDLAGVFDQLVDRHGAEAMQKAALRGLLRDGIEVLELALEILRQGKKTAAIERHEASAGLIE